MLNNADKNFPWLSHYPAGIPATINPDAYQSLIELMEIGFKNNSQFPAFSNMNQQLTFGELDKLSKDFASYLQSVGMQPGDRIAIQMPNLLQNPVAMFGSLRAGLVVVNTNPLYTSREMLHQFKDSKAKAIVILSNFASKLEAILPETSIEQVIVTDIGDLLNFPKRLLVNAVVKYVKKMVPDYSLSHAVSFRKAVRIGSEHSYSKPNIKGTDQAFIQYTGGTTGVSKGAVLSHSNLIANVEAINEWLIATIKSTGGGNQLVMAAPLPLYHVFALTINALCGLKWGAHNILITNPRDLPAFVKDLAKYPVNIFPGLNTLFNSLLNHEAFQKLDFSQLKVTIAGGMALQRVVAENWKKVTGCDLVEGYGLSETAPVLSVNPLNGKHRNGTIGLPIPSTEMRIRLEDETWAPIGERGEICAKGPQVMEGYYNRPDETAKVLFTDEDGTWFRTGDIGIQDEDGFFKIVDRKKDMILVSGFNVYPNEIEDVVALCPGVLEVACVGIPDEKSGEAVKLFIVKKDPGLTTETVIKYCRTNLTGYKCPKTIEFREELPKSNVGKILRRELRNESLN